MHHNRVLHPVITEYSSALLAAGAAPAMNATLGEDHANATHRNKPKTSPKVVRWTASRIRVDHDRLWIWWFVKNASSHCCNGSAGHGQCSGRNWHAELHGYPHERLSEHGCKLEPFRNRLQRHNVRNTLQHHVYIGNICGACKCPFTECRNFNRDFGSR